MLKMKRIQLLFVLFFFAIQAFSIFPISQPLTVCAELPGIVYRDDFERFVPGDVQAPWSNVSTDKTICKATIADDPVVGGTRGKVLRIENLPSTVTPAPNLYAVVKLATGTFADQSGVFITEYDSYVENSKDVAFQLYSREVDWPYAAGIMYNAIGQFSPIVSVGTPFPTPLPVDINRSTNIGSWHKVIIETDVPNQRYRYSLNYGRKSDWIGFRPDTTAPIYLHQNICSVSFATGNNTQPGTVYVDNLLIYNPAVYTYATPSMESPAKTFYHEDFQNGDTSRWINNITCTQEAENFFLRYTKASQSSALSYISLFDASRPSYYNASKVQFTSDFRISADTASDAGVALTLTKHTSPATDGISIGITPNGLQYSQSSAYHAIADTAITKDVWHRLKIIYNIYLSQYDIYLDGVLKKPLMDG